MLAGVEGEMYCLGAPEEHEQQISFGRGDTCDVCARATPKRFQRSAMVWKYLFLVAGFSTFELFQNKSFYNYFLLTDFIFGYPIIKEVDKAQRE